MYLYLMFFAFNGIYRRAVIPRVHLGILKLTLLALIPNGAVSFVDTSNVHIVVKTGALLSKHLGIGRIEYASCLTCISRLLSTHILKRYYQHQAPENS